MKFYNRNDLAARKVLTIVKRLAREDGGRRRNDDMVFIEVYENGREHGFAIESPTGYKIAFAENRNSDDIVVYYGESLDFQFNTNIPSEKIFAERTFFAYNEFEKAAAFIFNRLKA